MLSKAIVYELSSTLSGENDKNVLLYCDEKLNQQQNAVPVDADTMYGAKLIAGGIMDCVPFKYKEDLRVLYCCVSIMGYLTVVSYTFVA